MNNVSLVSNKNREGLLSSLKRVRKEAKPPPEPPPKMRSLSFYDRQGRFTESLEVAFGERASEFSENLLDQLEVLWEDAFRKGKEAPYPHRIPQPDQAVNELLVQEGRECTSCGGLGTNPDSVVVIMCVHCDGRGWI